ncbi:MAG: beta-1,6-N-acetylglucosaminyltransferase [Methylococcales bacterium]|nr:beta-1,6-N-acetylglucosaminyltransferase [Methylococcales bacterium]
MRVVFGILSSNNTAEAIQQIIDAIGSNHIVIIHHDFSKQPDFQVTGDNVHILEDYSITGWGAWTLVEAVIKLIEKALQIPEWDYFQLLSDTCLPIRPIQEFEHYLETEKPDANISCFSFSEQPDLLLTHGFRAFSPKGNSFSHRLLRRVTKFSNEMRGMDGYRMLEALTIPVYTNDDKLMVKLFAVKLPKFLFRLAMKGIGFNHPFRGSTQAYVGSQFFGCSREVCQQIQDWMETNKDLVEGIKTQVAIPDEFFFQTIIGNLNLPNRQTTNHLVNFFDSKTRHGNEFELSDADRLNDSGKFFARKFSKNPDDAMRLQIIKRI